MARPTIRDVAEHAGVSIATVNRLLAGSSSVRGATAQRIIDAAQSVGFYGLGALQSRANASSQAVFKLAVLIQTPHQAFTHALGEGFEQAAHERGSMHVEVIAITDLSPEAVADHIRTSMQQADAICLQAADHPLVAEAIDEAQKSGCPVTAIISPLAATSPVGYVGLDSWKVGRTAAWACQRMSPPSGELAMFVGTHRFRCHDVFESGFRSYVREFMPNRQMIDPQATYESDASARELTEQLVRRYPNLSALYVSGGGIAGAIAALREVDPERKVLLIGHDVLPSTRAGLLDGRLALVIAHPYVTIAQSAMGVATKAKTQGENGQRVYIPFQLVSRENL